MTHPHNESVERDLSSCHAHTFDSGMYLHAWELFTVYLNVWYGKLIHLLTQSLTQTSKLRNYADKETDKQ